MAGLSCSEHLLRLFFIIFNIAFFLAGALLIGLGIWALVVSSDYDEFDVSYVTSVSGVLIAIGFVIFLVGFLGCCGAFKNNHWMMFIYAILVLILLCLQIACGIYAFVNLDDAENLLRDSMVGTMDNYEKDPPTKKAWDEVQKDLKCCGSTGPSSWTDHMNKSMSVPDTCCKEITEGCGQTLADYNDENIYQEGCAKAVKSEIEDSFLVLALIAVIVAMGQIIGIICACCLGNAFRDYERVDGQEYRAA